MVDTATKIIELVMLVDDNDTDNFISKRIIEITKFASRVEVKSSGKSALDYLKENQNAPADLPNIIFLDINMPIVDGFVFLYEFDKFSELVKNKCKIIILSSSDNKRDIDKIVNNNHVIKFITKPLTEVALDEIKLNNIWFILFLVYLVLLPGINNLKQTYATQLCGKGDHRATPINIGGSTPDVCTNNQEGLHLKLAQGI